MIKHRWWDPALRAKQPETEALMQFLAEAHVHGVGVDWAAVLAPHHPERVSLPTYAFQRQRYWLSARASGAGDVSSVGLVQAGHPLLGAAVGLGDEQGWLFSARLSAETHPWLADHAVFDVALLPGTAFVEMALAAGAQAGLNRLEELLLQAPLLIPEHGAIQLQLLIGAADEAGRCRVDIYSRPEDSGDQHGVPWVRHATGMLAAGAAETGGFEDLATWPPADAEAIPVERLYDRLADSGFHYGPAFQGVRAMWRRGEQVFAEIAFDDDAIRTSRRLWVASGVVRRRPAPRRGPAPWRSGRARVRCRCRSPGTGSRSPPAAPRHCGWRCTPPTPDCACTVSMTPAPR